MRVSIVVAMDRQRAIGKDGVMPWHLPADLKNFRHITLGKPIIMGRKTYQSIGRPLPGRENIVVSRNPLYSAPGCTVVRSLETALTHANSWLNNQVQANDATRPNSTPPCDHSPEAMIVGGTSLYRAALTIAQRIYLTEVHGETGGDVYFPKLNGARWLEVSRVFRPRDENNGYSLSFVILERREPSAEIGSLQDGGGAHKLIGMITPTSSEEIFQLP